MTDVIYREPVARWVTTSRVVPDEAAGSEHAGDVVEREGVPWRVVSYYSYRVAEGLIHESITYRPITGEPAP